MQSAGQEFRIAIAGPALSVLLGVVLTAAGLAVPGDGAQVLFYLGFVNFALGVFNLLPGFPLDGGRVFRSIVWARTHDLARSTRIAARVGTGIAWAMILLGIMTVLYAGIVGLWYVLIGLFLKSASESAYGELVLERTLAGVRVRDVMRPPPDPVDAGTTLARLIEERVLARGERALFVGRNGGVAGLLTTTDLARVPRDQYATTTAAEAMVPAERVVTVEPQAPLLDAMRLMVRRDVHQLPVLEGGRMVGLLSRADVIQQLEARERFGQAAPRPERP
jgi:CBS domain-containing protein